MMLSLSNSLSRTRRSGLDADALAWIAATEAVGATWTGAQRTVISDFYVDEKASGRWDGVKRMYLPVTGIAAANAICMKSLTSGTFVGGVTHGAGYVQGNGSTGYFDSGVAVNSLLTTGNASMFALNLEDLQYYQGTYGAGPTYPGLEIGDSGGTLIGFCPADASAVAVADTGGGIHMVSQTATDARSLYKRVTAGFSTVGSNSISDSTALPALNPYFAGAFNNNGSPGAFTSGKHGAYGFGTGLAASAVEAFTLNLKNLWEDVTPLSLP